MEISDKILNSGERISLSLRELYSANGYKAYKMGKFEEYDLYAENKEFLVSEGVITFTDMSGKLMALKPDVTLSIIKNGRNLPDEISKVYYSENVYRVKKDAGSFKEIMQTGLECYGPISEKEIKEVIILAAKSLKLISGNSVLSLSDFSVITGLIKGLNLGAKDSANLLKAVSEKNSGEIASILESSLKKEKAAAFIKLINISGKARAVIKDLVPIEKTIDSKEFSEFIKILKELSEIDCGDVFSVDFSLTGDANYYSGIIFRGFIDGIPDAVLSGGQYDNLMKKLGKNSRAIGFAVYVDMLARLDEKSAGGKKDDFINVALPKGRLGEKVYALFASAGYECPAVLNPNRKLVFENARKKVRYFWVKPSDVPIYVERGAADVGVAGKDIIAEYEPDVFELIDLKEGNCKMVVAAPAGFNYDDEKTLRVATKFKNVAEKFYRSRGMDIDVIHLNGSIEIAPILKLSDVIVDIVETGATLKENDLTVIETVFPVSARFIANKASFKFKEDAIKNMTEKLAVAAEKKL